MRVEGTRMAMERIGLELGIARCTLYCWQKRFGWQRPNPPDRPWPCFFRARRFGRPYGGDAVGTARDGVKWSDLPLRKIAARAGVSPATVWRWMTDRGWTRPPGRPGSRRDVALRRAAATVPVGGRPGRAYPDSVVAAARELFQTTELPTVFIALRVKVCRDTVLRWARAGGWTRPDDAWRRRRDRRREGLPRPVERAPRVRRAGPPDP